MMKNKGCGAHIAYAGLAMLALLLASCYTPKRCARVLYKCGILTDTVQVWDSIRIERVITDTLLRWDSLRLHDTVTIERGNARLKLLRLPGDSIWVAAECKDTTIWYVRKVVQPIQRVRYIPVWTWVVMFLLLIFAIRKRNS